MKNSSLKVNRLGEAFTEPIDMSANKVMSNYIAVDKTDLISKEYIDLRYVSNNCSFIPDLIENSNKSGFVVFSSSVFSLGTALFLVTELSINWNKCIFYLKTVKTAKRSGNF